MSSNTHIAPANVSQPLYKQLSEKARQNAVTQISVCASAQQNYNAETGRIDWDSVAHESSLSVIECLRWFIYDHIKVKPRELPNKKWPEEDLDDMRQFIKRTFADEASIEWELVAKYINTSTTSCIDAYGKLTRHRWTDEEVQRIAESRASGHRWNKVRQVVGIPTTIHSYQHAYYKYLEKQNNDNEPFTAEERRRVKEIYRQSSLHEYKDPKLIALVTEEFPEKSRKAIEGVLLKIYSSFAHTFIGYESLVKLFGLVETYGQDWAKIGKIMDMCPVTVKTNWIKNKDRFHDATVEWTEDEMKIVNECVERGLGPKEVAVRIPTKVYAQCHARIYSIKRSKPTQE